MKKRFMGADMLRHIVMLKMADEAEGATGAENAAEAKRRLEALTATIPEIQRLEVGIQALDDPGASDLALTVDVADEAALKTYAVHPDHQEVVAFIKKVVTERRVVDYFL
ncbi:MAG: Dabb family protein [Acidobacteriota bacterium]|nr:Dabb family protein [Acidobacteriota bacterium]